MGYRFKFAFVVCFALIAAPALASTPAAEPVVTDLLPPWSCGEEYRVSQGNHGKTHNGWGTYAWDFSTPKGTVVTAPVDGTIRKLRDDSERYGCDASYGWDANYVVIDMGNGYDVLLLHLKANSALVEEGDRVKAGQPLAAVGNSGWVCGTHLHVQVQQSCRSWWCPSVPASFADYYNPETGTHISQVACVDDNLEVAEKAERPIWSRILTIAFPRTLLQR